MKKFIILALASMSLIGTLYAGSCGSCGGCSGKKDKGADTMTEGEASTEAKS